MTSLKNTAIMPLREANTVAFAVIAKRLCKASYRFIKFLVIQFVQATAERKLNP